MSPSVTKEWAAQSQKACSKGTAKSLGCPRMRPRHYRKKSLKAPGASSRAGFVRFSGGISAREGVTRPVLCSWVQRHQSKTIKYETPLRTPTFNKLPFGWTSRYSRLPFPTLYALDPGSAAFTCDAFNFKCTSIRGYQWYGKIAGSSSAASSLSGLNPRIG